jgi:hypothetical protein
MTRGITEMTELANTYQILYAYEDELGNDVIASLDFWQAANGAAGHK